MSFQNPTISLCMIVKNEAENLPHCLEPIAGVFDQIVIVDTGSTDNTVQIAKSYGAEVHYFEWIDDFSAARNESLKHATGDYIFFLDGDDRMEHAEALKLKELITPLETSNISKCKEVKVSNGVTPKKDIAFYCWLYCYEANGQDTEIFQLRLFPNLPGVEFEGLVHEQVAYSLQRLGIRSQACDVKITHIGYKDADAVMRKIHRNIPLLEQQIKKTPERVNVRLHLVTHYNNLGETEKAIAQLEHLIKQTEEEDGYREAFLICCVMLGNSYRKINKHEEAIEMYRRALLVEPDYGLAHFLLGELYYKLGRIPEARMELLIAQNTGIQLCRTPIPRRAIYYYISYFLGRCHEEKGDMNLAIMEYKQAIAMSCALYSSTAFTVPTPTPPKRGALPSTTHTNEPTSAEVYTRLGNLYMQRGEYDKAQEAFNQATLNASVRCVDTTPSTVQPLSSLCKPALERNEGTNLATPSPAPEASHKMPSVIALEQNYNQAANHCNLGIAYLYQGKLKEAEKAFKEAINFDPKRVEVYSNLGLTYAKQNNFTEAENNYLKALEIEPNRIEALTNLAYLYLRAGKLTEAEERFLCASEIEPKAVDIHLALANIYAQRHQFALVQKQYDEIIYNCPELEFGIRNANFSPNFSLSLPLNEVKGKKSSIIRNNWNSSIIRNTEELKEKVAQLTDGFHLIGEQLVLRNRVAEAILAFKVAVAIEPQFVEALGRLAELYQQVKNYKEAIEMYEAVLRAEPKNYSAFYQLGECYLATGTVQAARLCYLHTLELKHDLKPALERLRNCSNDFKACP